MRPPHLHLAQTCACLTGRAMLCLTVAATVIVAPPSGAVQAADPIDQLASGPAAQAPVTALTRAPLLPTTRPGRAARPLRGPGRTLRSRFEANVRIPSARIHRSVYRGGQRVIDHDVVAHYTGWRGTFVRAGQPGVYWLAAHNYGTYGPFHRLLGVGRGARVIIRTRTGQRFVYRVTRTRIVNASVPPRVVWGRWGPREGPPRAVLQTCRGDQRKLVYAKLVRPRR